MKAKKMPLFLTDIRIKFIRKIILSIIALLGPFYITAVSSATDVTLQWNASSGADYYIVYYGTTSGKYTLSTSQIKSPLTQVTIAGLAETTWYFSMKSFNNSGNSSDYSDEIVRYSDGSTSTTSSVYSPLSVSISSPVLLASINTGGSVNFQGLISGGLAPLSYSWNFGVGGPSGSSIEDPGNVTFPNAGTYTVTFSVTDALGSSESATVIVTVSNATADSSPVAAISSPSSTTTIVQGGSVNFQGAVSGGNSPYTYSWTFGNSGVAAKTVEDPGNLIFNTAGTFTVTFTVTDSDGDVSSVTRTVVVTKTTTTSSTGTFTSTTGSTSTSTTVDVNPVASITSPSSAVTINQGGTVYFQGNVSSGNAPFRYRWYFGQGGPRRLSVEDPGNVRFPTAGTYKVTFFVMDNDRDTSQASVVVTVTSKASGVSDTAIQKSPEDGEHVSITPTLHADVDESAGETQWQVSSDVSFENVVLDVIKTNSSSVLKVPALVLEGDTTYYWRVKQNKNASSISNWSSIRTFVTDPVDWNDKDGNGVPDSQETAEDTDLNNDGIADHSQDIIKTVMSFNGNSSIGLVKVENVLDIELLEAMNLSDIDDASGAPSGMPGGIYGFRILTKNPGDSAVIEICLDSPAPENTGWFKYDTVLGWQDYSSLAMFSADRKTITVELTDGGDGDADGIMNGVIVDPAGLGYSLGVSSGVSADQKGCFIGTARLAVTFKALFAILAVMVAGGGYFFRKYNRWY
jgi:PKD repeat protein